MEILDENAMEEMAEIAHLRAKYTCMNVCLCLLVLRACDREELTYHCRTYCAHLCGHRFAPKLTEALTACGEEFYVKCPEFDQIGRICDFEPALNAAKWKEKVQLEKVVRLESRVQELEAALKKK